jgi:hypothetical protein
MAQTALDQLWNLARQDEALRTALEATSTSVEVQRVASQRGLTLSDGDAQQWLVSQAALEAALSPAELDALSAGLSDHNRAAVLLDDNALIGVVGGAGIGDGEALEFPGSHLGEA